MWFRRSQAPVPDFVCDPARHRPALRCSICTGEQTGVFHDVMLIRNQQDLQAFTAQYHITEKIEKIY